MEQLISFNFEEAEKRVIQEPSSRKVIKEHLVKLQHRVDYIVSRFIDDHPDYEKNPLKHKFYVDKSETYSKITRLLRVIQAYES